MTHNHKVTSSSLVRPTNYYLFIVKFNYFYIMETTKINDYKEDNQNNEKVCTANICYRDPDLYEDYVEFPDGYKDCPYFK